jgi:Ca-activated chloride channel homolog
MRFANPLFFLLLVPVWTLFFLYISGKIGRDAVLRFSSVDLLKKSGGVRLSAGRVLAALMRAAALTLVVAALARPQTGTGETKSTQQVIDIVISLDVSGSMATLDFQPDNRLVAAKLEAKRFIEARGSDRIGLVIFSGQSATQCPLTTDHKAILTLLDQIQLGTMQDGTAIGLGLASAVNRLKDSEAKSKVVVLLTDGVNNAGEIDPLTASGLAKQFGVRVYTVGVGKEGTSFLPVSDPVLGTRLLRVETQIDERLMQTIAKQTGGIYFRAQDSRSLRDIFREIDKLEKTEIEVENFMHYEERFFWFLWPALFVLLAELVWRGLIFVKIP